LALFFALLVTVPIGLPSQKAKENDRTLPTAAQVLADAENAMGTETDRAAIHSITAIAACHGPKGNYETRMIADRNGDLSFQQFLIDHHNIAGIVNGQGWHLNEKGNYEPIDAVESSILRSHDFPMMALDLAKRFHDVHTVAFSEFENQPTIDVVMTDELGHAVTAYFSRGSRLPIAPVSENPRSGSPRLVTTRFDSWGRVANVNLVSHATILFGSETYTFDFTTLQVNVVDKTAFAPKGK
jgi:hypothetical protein